jgi:hypothetical protein
MNAVLAVKVASQMWDVDVWMVLHFVREKSRKLENANKY